MMTKPDLRALSADLSLRVCKRILGDENEQCKLLYEKAKAKEIGMDEFFDEMESLVNQIVPPVATPPMPPAIVPEQKDGEPGP